MPDDIEIPESERWLSVIAGGMLVLSSLRRRGVWSGILFTAGGSALIARGFLGHDGWLGAIRLLLLGEPEGAAEPGGEGELEA
jgi:uncharacterized membrane protein